MTENEKARDKIRIVAICGSLRPGSYTRMALQVACGAPAKPALKRR